MKLGITVGWQSGATDEKIFRSCNTLAIDDITTEVGLIRIFTECNRRPTPNNSRRTVPSTSLIRFSRTTRPCRRRPALRTLH